MSPVSTLHAQVDAYLVARRAMGFELRTDERQLRAFARFGDHEGHRGPVTLALAVRWAQRAPGSTRLTWARRLQTLRPFTTYQAVLDADTEVVPAGLFGPVARRLVPHIYTETEIAALLDAAAQLRQVTRALQRRSTSTRTPLMRRTGKPSRRSSVNCSSFWTTVDYKPRQGWKARRPQVTVSTEFRIGGAARI